MPILLFTLLAVALSIIITGFFLSPRPQKRPQRAGYYTARSVRRTGEPLRARRSYVMQAERRTSFFTWPTLPVGRILSWRSGDQSSWMGLTLILVVIFLFGYMMLRTLLPASVIAGSPLLLDALGNPNQTSQGQSNPAPPSYNASQKLVRLSQLDPAQYANTNEYNTWAYSACSTASMTEVINSYGHHYRITDILRVESRLGEITPESGLLEDIGIQRTVAQFGFNTVWGHNLSLDQVIAKANGGTPVIVSFPPETWDGGHLLVVTGGNKDTVFTADSSRLDHRSFARSVFTQYWRGFTAIVTPK